MNYIENVYICLAAPLIVAIICLGKNRKRLMIFFLLGMTACILSSYISTFFAISYGADRLAASVEIAPTIEEVMKLFPVIFYLLVFEPKKDAAVGCSIVTSVGFATFENVCYLMENDASEVIHLLIRGFGTGAMHVITGVIVSIGLLYLWDKEWLRVAGVIALLCMSTLYHAIYNILVSQTGRVAFVGYSVPMITTLMIVIFKNRILTVLDGKKKDHK